VAAHRDRFECETCRWGRHCDASRPARIKQWVIKDARGRVQMESDICLLPMITPFSSQIMDLLQHYRQGRFPLGGGVLDQPNAYLEAMRVVENRLATIEKEQREKRH
jgi:hypothetical protein